jgi:DNA mismatch repair protein MutL
VRSALMAARPAAAFMSEINMAPSARVALTPPLPGSAAEAFHALAGEPTGAEPGAAGEFSPFSLAPQQPFARNEVLPFTGSIPVEGNGAVGAARMAAESFGGTAQEAIPETASSCALPLDGIDDAMDLSMLGTLRPLGQIRDSFILAINPQGLWIIDQHVAHERVLFEKILEERSRHKVEAQRLLMPIIVELKPAQQAIFTEIAEELRRNGFEAELFGVRTIAVQTAPAGIPADDVARMLQELLEQFEREEQVLNLEKIRSRIAASIACHAAIKVNMPLDTAKMEWLLAELAKTRYPMSCPHGRPIVLRYSVKDIQKAFKRI